MHLPTSISSDTLAPLKLGGGEKMNPGEYGWSERVAIIAIDWLVPVCRCRVSCTPSVCYAVQDKGQCGDAQGMDLSLDIRTPRLCIDWTLLFNSPVAPRLKQERSYREIIQEIHYRSPTNSPKALAQASQSDTGIHRRTVSAQRHDEPLVRGASSVYAELLTCS